jgi:hypothetical protein
MKNLSYAPLQGRLLALPTNIRLGWKRNAGDKHSSFFRKFVNYRQKKFYNIGPWDPLNQKNELISAYGVLYLLIKLPY